VTLLIQLRYKILGSSEQKLLVVVEQRTLERQEALTAVSLVSQVFWDAKLCRSVGGSRRFEVI